MSRSTSFSGAQLWKRSARARQRMGNNDFIGVILGCGREVRRWLVRVLGMKIAILRPNLNWVFVKGTMDCAGAFGQARYLPVVGRRNTCPPAYSR